MPATMPANPKGWLAKRFSGRASSRYLDVCVDAIVNRLASHRPRHACIAGKNRSADQTRDQTVDGPAPLAASLPEERADDEPRS